MPIFVIFYILFTQYYTSNNTQTPTFASKYKSIIMSTFQNTAGRMTNYRWIICAMLFFATTVNYLDRQVLFIDLERFHLPRIPLDRYTLRLHHSYLFHCLCLRQSVCRTFHRLDGNEKRVFMGHCRMVYRRLYARPLRTCHRNDPRH